MRQVGKMDHCWSSVIRSQEFIIPSFFLLCVFEIFIHRAFAAPEDTYLTKPKARAPQRQHDMAHQRTGLHRGFLCDA